MSYINCNGCYGQGYITITGMRKCHTCCGTGRDMTTDLYMDYCKICKGSKTITYCNREKCNRCGGSGRLLHFSGEQQYNIYMDYRNSRR